MAAPHRRATFGPTCALARGTQRRGSGPELRPCARPAASVERTDAGHRLCLCPGTRLPRRAQGPAAAARPFRVGYIRCRGQALRGHGAGDGEAAGGPRGHRLAGQAHQPRLPPPRFRGSSSASCSRPSTSRPTRPRPTVAAPAAGASTSARPTPSRRPTGSMPGAASPTSPSSTRATSRPNSARL